MKAIGIDIGTTGIGGILLDAENGRVLKSVTKNSNSFILTDNAFEKIQSVDKIIGIATEILDGLVSNEVVAIGVTGQMHGILYYDKDGNAVSPLFTWQDERGDLPYQDTTYAKYLGSCSGYGCVTDFYNKVNGLVPKTAVGFCSIADYLVMKLCQTKSPLIHTTNGASFGCYDIKSKKFSYDCNIELTDEFAIVGCYKNIPVSVAIGDNQASVLGSCRQDELLINVGTGSQVSVISEHCVLGENIETRPYFEGKYLTVGSALCGGRAYSLTKDFLREILSAKGEVLDDEVYSIMTDMLNGLKNPTVKADTRFAGTRQDKAIRGGFYNISVNNFKPAEFIHAVLQGMAEELFSLYNGFGESRKILVGTGNGVRKNPHFIKCAESLFSANLKIPMHAEEASFGSALFALIAVGKFKTVAEAQRLIQYLG
jgi:sedoheptulokinase